MNIYLSYFLAAVVAYLIGSFPSGVVASKLSGTPDVRYVGSGHTGGTNTMRQAGPWLGITVVIADALKGLIAWGAAYLITRGDPWALPLAGSLAVIGHCWPVYIRFHGGMGLATAGALILILSRPTILIAVALWAVFFLGVFKKRYSPRCVMLALIGAVTLSILFLPLDVYVKWTLGLLAIILLIRHLPEWNRVN